MLETYQSHGVRFEFPRTWEISEQGNAQEALISVESPETSFWSLALFFDCPSPERVLETAVSALEADYGEMDIYPTKPRICGREGIGRDVEFVCLELINSAYFRAFQTDAFTALVYFQGTDYELEQTRQVLEAMTASLSCETEIDPLNGPGSP